MAAGTAIGGSVCIEGGTVSITRSTFTDHSSSGGMRGCAIGNDGGTVTIDSCYFDGNIADKADDVHNASGSITAYNCTWNEIGQTGGTFTIEDSGNPTVFEGSISYTNTTAPSYTADPDVPVTSGDCASGIILLPVELVVFNGECINSKIMLNWSTASEINNDYFIIERSKDAFIFDEIGRVDGSGNSSEIHNYEFVDKNPIEGIAYYRLQQVDFNGDAYYSELIAVEYDCQINDYIEYVFFNSSTDEIIIGFSQMMDEPFSFCMYDVSGKLMLTKRINPINQTEVSISIGKNISSSIYLINLKNKQFTNNSKLFINR
jgi:hypothetical protein